MYGIEAIRKRAQHTKQDIRRFSMIIKKRTCPFFDNRKRDESTKRDRNCPKYETARNQVGVTLQSKKEDNRYDLKI